MKLSAFPFYGTLSSAGRSVLSDNLKSFSCEKGQIVSSGACGMILVEEGILSVSLLSEEGKEVTLFRLRPGDLCFLSAAGSLFGLSFDVTITAEAPATLQRLPCEYLSLLMKTEPAFSDFVHGNLLNNFSDTVKLLQNVLFRDFDERLAAFLYEEMTESNSTTLSLTHEQIARHIGSAREVVSRALKRFVQQGIVSVSRGTVTICNAEKLKDLAL